MRNLCSLLLPPTADGAYYKIKKKRPHATFIANGRPLFGQKSFSLYFIAKAKYKIYFIKLFISFFTFFTIWPCNVKNNLCYFFIYFIFSNFTVCCHPLPSHKSRYSSTTLKSSFISHFKYTSRRLETRYFLPSSSIISLL